MDRIENIAARPQLLLQKPQHTTAEASKTFSDMLGNAIGQVNKSQVQSDQVAEKLINGNAANLHNVMIEAEKASVTLTAAVEVRNKTIDAYHTIMRMQV